MSPRRPSDHRWSRSPTAISRSPGTIRPSIISRSSRRRGVRIGSQIDVGTALAGTAVGPELAALADGGLAIAFTSNQAPLSDGSGRAVFVQVIGADGLAIGGPVQVNSQTNGDQIDPGIVGLDDGSFVVTWTDLNGTGADDDQVMAQLFAPHWSVAITSGDGEDDAAVSAAENGTAVTIVAAANHGGAAISYVLMGGADAALFAIDAVTGALTFIGAPDFEAPGDADGDNVYEVVVGATDGLTSDSQALAVILVNANEGLAIVSDGGDPVAVSVDENTTLVAAVLAEDVDGDTPDYFIAGGADAALFEFEAGTGTLRFIGARDFETPGDADGDNVYEVIVGATDGEYFDYQTISATHRRRLGGADLAAPVLALSSGENATAVGTVVAQSAERRDDRLCDRRGRRCRAVHDRCADGRAEPAGRARFRGRPAMRTATMSMTYWSRRPTARALPCNRCRSRSAMSTRA